MKRGMNQQKLKVQPVKNQTRNIKEVKMSLLKDIYMKFMKVAKEMITLVVIILLHLKKQKMRSSTDSVNYNDDFFSGFDASTCSGDNIYDIFDNEDKIINEDSNVWVKTNKIIWE